jgi:hypothetical protein
VQRVFKTIVGKAKKVHRKVIPKTTTVAKKPPAYANTGNRANTRAGKKNVQARKDDSSSESEPSMESDSSDGDDILEESAEDESD